MSLTVEQANAHDSGDCGCDCPHPDCVWAGAVALQDLWPALLFDQPESPSQTVEPVVL